MQGYGPQARVRPTSEASARLSAMQIVAPMCRQGTTTRATKRALIANLLNTLRG